MTERQSADQTASPRLSAALSASVFAIRWERLWRQLWAPLAVLVLFVGIALTDILPALPDLLHAVVLVLLSALFGASLVGLRHAARPVSEADAARRVETASNLRHRPLTALYDVPAEGRLSAAAETLWREHIRAALRQTERLKMPMPKPGLAGLDPLGLRFVPVLILFVGVLIGGADPWPRLQRALTPMTGTAASSSVAMDLWITPPAYTGLAPSVFNHLSKATAAVERPALIVPVGAQILVQATDAGATPSLGFGNQVWPLTRLGDTKSKSYKLEMTVESSAVGADQLQLRVGTDVIATWPVQIAADAPPRIEFERAPSRRHDTQLEVSYLAGDDYGVKTIGLKIVRPNGQPVPGGENEISVDLPIAGDRRAIEASTARDFSAHPWAGLPVRVRLVAEDTAGQTTSTETVEVVLPERIFNHPVARALAESRKALNDPTPEVIAQAAEAVRELSLYPKRFFDDTVAFLAMRSVWGRLSYGTGAAEVPGVQRLLWETALRIEDGEFALAEADLMRLQERAMEALRDGKLGDELDSVMRELQEAMDRFVQALAERLQELGLDQVPPMAGQQDVQAQDLQEMMDRIRELAETGNRAAAEQMLAEMQQMLQQMREGMRMQQSNPAMAEAKQLMDKLRSLTDDQQKLLDRTFGETNRDNRQGAMRQPQLGQQQGPQPGQQQGQQPGQQPGQQQDGQQPGEQSGEGSSSENGTPSAADQEALRKKLGELMMQMDALLGQIPDNMGRAEQQMEQAGKNLGKGEFRDATGNQAQALQELRDATSKMAESMAQQFGAQMGLSTGTRSMPGGQSGTDPFGRRNPDEAGQGNAAESGDVDLPSQMETRRAREIMDELRRRAGDRDRPVLERNYIDRLLDIF